VLLTKVFSVMEENNLTENWLFKITSIDRLFKCSLSRWLVTPWQFMLLFQYRWIWLANSTGKKLYTS